MHQCKVFRRSKGDILAYIDGCEFLFHVVDDIDFSTPGWSETFVNTLANSTPKWTGKL